MVVNDIECGIASSLGWTLGEFIAYVETTCKKRQGGMYM